MNNIYKVIWSKAKNCYVVASEIARSHTKSASGSEKIGGGTRRKLLASLMALSLLCGGLGVAEATVHVNEGTGVTSEVYTTGETYSRELIDEKLNSKADATVVATNTKDIVANKDNITRLENNKADTKTVNALVGHVGALETTVGNASKGLVKDVADLNAKTTKIDYDAANDTTSINGIQVGDQVDMGGKKLTNVGTINGINIGDAQVDMGGKKLTDVGTINGIDIGDAEVNMNGKNLTGVGTINGIDLGTVDTQVKTNADAIAQEKTDRENAIGNLTEDKNYIKKDKNVSDNLVELDKQAKTNADAITETNQRTAGITRDDTKKETSIEGRVTVDTNGNIKAEGTITSNGLDARAGEIKTTGKVSAGDVSTGTLETTGNAKIGGDLTVDGKLNVGEIYMKNDTHESTGKTHDSATAITADGISNRAKVTDENGNTTESKFTHNEKGTFNYAKDEKITGEWKGATSNVTADGVSNKMTDSAGNTHTYYQTAAETKEQLVNGNKSNFEKKTAEGNTISIKDKDADGNKKSLTNKQTVDGEKTSVTNKDSSSTVNQGADQIRNYVASTDGKKSSTEVKADGITNTSKDGTITNDAKDIVNNATGDMTNTVGGQLNTTVTGQATENFNGGLNTNVTGTENHTVTGNQNIHVTKNQTNKIDGDQVNIIGGSQTTTATDINRNASSSMVDKVDNAYGTNTETKEAGKTTTDVSIKGTGEKGKYIRGANESRDYLINGTLKNSETKTVEKTSTEITDGNGNTSSTIQDVKNLAGSVTNGTEIGVSGIHANADGSVSIDSAVAGGGMSSVINQKKDSITSAVGDGTNSTVILQDKDNVTIASSKGMVAIGGKDIVNNAQDTITNTAGTKITDKAGDSTVTTEKAKGTTFTKTGSTAYSTKAGAPTDTNIAGNHITTGRVDANELGVSDKDGANTADLSVEAGEDGGVKASAGNGTTTGSLDVTAKEIGSSVTDASGKGSTFKQRIDAIMMESKNVSIKAEETLTNEAKDIVTKASNSITEKVGETNVTTKTTTSSKSEIQNADTITSVQQTENMVQSYVGKKDLSATNVTTNFANASANQVTENGQTSTVLNNKDGLLIQNTANGNSFTTEDGTPTGPAQSWTNIKGNEISTGKVEANYVKMGYADVMKDLGVRGNANITGKTTTGSLEVTGTSTLTGDVTMGSNATVGNNLTVKGITTTKTLKVTENAEIDGNATIKGDVTARSYKVGGNTYIDADGIHANNQKITDVADGSISEGSKDAVNGGQLYGMKMDLEHKVDKVGANAAAMANLHPMEFDPDSKWNIAAAMGNYGSETATAIGAFYRPNEDVMVNFSTAFGTGENMVGGGVSVRLGKGSNKLSREESNALKDQVDDLTARMDALLSVLNPNMSKDFPDVPENHWAYEAVSRLAGNDIVQGYPDGEFHGDRTMTRYEMAEIIYNALSRGAEAERELVEEFKPELQAMAASEKATAERAEG